MSQTYAIIGAGHGAGQAAASLRQLGFEGRVVLVGEELYLPYQRPPLSKKFLAGELDKERTYFKPAGFYEERQVELKLSTRAESIDAAEKTVVLSNGESLTYEKLLLCLGSQVRRIPVPGAELPGVFYLRTIDDVLGIQQKVRSGNKVVIVGGGYIGLEVASVGIDQGLNVYVLEMESRILQRVTTADMSHYYHELHTGRGVNIHTDTAVTGFSGSGKVEKVLCGDAGEFDADLVIVGIGIIPNVELAQDAGLECDNGIVVDDHCRTSDPDIYAAGDCTNHPNPLLQRRLRLESVPNAMEQARVCATNMLGGDKTYASIPWFWSDQYELKLQMVGFSSDGDEHVVRGSVEDNKFAVFYLNNGTVVAADAVNSPKEFMICKKLIGKKVDPMLLASPDTELKTLLA